MDSRKVFGALRATTLAALCAGGLIVVTAGCESSKDSAHGEKGCKGDKGCSGDKMCGGEKACGGDKSCGEKACG